VPQVEVSFDIDANGILNVSAKDKGTGKEQRITITASSGLNEDEIQKMVDDAEAHAEDDKRKREEIQTRNEAENAIYTAEKLLEENTDKIPDELKTDVQNKIEDVRAASQGDDTEKIKTSLQELMSVLQTVGQHVYQEPDDSGKSQEDTTDDTPPEGTVEGEFREV